MADTTNEAKKSIKRDQSADSSGIHPILSQASTVQEDPAPATSDQEAPPEELRITSLHRAGTLPAQHAYQQDGNGIRPRGRTISARPQNLQPRELSPRSQLFKRFPARPGNNEGSLGPIPERGQGSSGSGSRRPRRSTTSDHEEPNFVSPGMRRRMSTFSVQNGQRLNRRGTVLMAPEGQQPMATGRDMEEQSINFTLAGPGPMDSQAANQPYVEPGYSDLNPAYDQPINTRPVWGLAKPLPRVVRPGMIPTRSELKIQIPEAEGRRQDPENVDLEQGRVEPTLNLGKITSQLQNARQDRENRFIQGNLQRTGTGFSPASPLARRQTHASSHVEPFSPGSHAIEEEEEEDLGLAKPRPNDLAPVPEQPLDPVPGQGNQPEGEQGWYPDDAASAMTEKLGADDLDGDWIGDEVPLKAYDPESDEIHNLHTHWSVIRLRFREPLAELLAVICQLTLGFCADLVVVTSSSKAGNEATTDWAWGLATMVGIYIAGGISGAHLNPAISIMLWIYRGFPLRKVPIYMAAQILGAFIAALIAFGLYQEGIVSFANGATLGDSGTTVAFLCYPRQTYIGGATAFFTEFTSTSILAVAVLALGDDTNAPPGAGMNALVLGLLITVLSMAFGYNTGAAMNPARDLGPRLALLAVGYGSEIFTNPYWVYGNWVGPITGAIFGAFLYDAAIFVGGESPVNYPRKRIARASKKWQRRWGKRLSRTRRRIVAGGRKEDGFEGVKGRDLR